MDCRTGGTNNHYHYYSNNCYRHVIDWYNVILRWIKNNL